MGPNPLSPKLKTVHIPICFYSILSLSCQASPSIFDALTDVSSQVVSPDQLIPMVIDYHTGSTLDGYLTVIICLPFIVTFYRAGRLVGGLEHEFFMTFQIFGIIIPTDFHIFQRGRYTTNQILILFCRVSRTDHALSGPYWHI